MTNSEGENFVSRRQVLKLLRAGLIIGVPSLLTGNNLDILARLRRSPHHSYDPDAMPVLPDAEKLAINNNPRLRQLGKHTVAYAVVHAGYQEASTDDLSRQLIKKRIHDDYERKIYNRIVELTEGKRGDYGEYVRAMTRLFQILGQTAAPVLCFVEQRDALNPTIPRPEFRPPDNAFLILTEDSDSAIRSKIPQPSKSNMEQTVYSWVPQDATLIFDGLRKAGVQEIHIAGEYSFNPVYNNPACLGGVAQQFMNEGFRVRGIKEVVYPTRPAKLPDLPVARALYDDAVGLSQVYGQAV